MGSERVIIIGAGAGGSAAAAGLTERGISVLLIDAGPAYDPKTDYHLHRTDWEATPFPYKPESRGEYRFDVGQALVQNNKHLRSWNRVSGVFNQTGKRQVSGMGYYHVRGLGGSTLRFTGEAHRMNRHAMRMNTDYGVAADWPLSYDELKPWYRHAETIIGVAGPGETEDRPGDRSHLQPPHPLGSGGRALKKGASRLGLSWVANDRAALSRPKDDRPACNYCGNCNRGCPREDKGSADVTFLRRAKASGLLEVRKRTRATRLHVEPESGQVSAIDLLGADGQTDRLRATGPVILAAGAIETPRLLLASANPEHPDGLANSSGQVGRNLLETLHCSVSAIATLDLASYKTLPADSICWDFNRPDSIPGVAGGCRFTHSTAEIGLAGPIAYAQRACEGFGTQFKRRVHEQFGHAVSISAIGESLPNPETYVDLHPTDRDRQGEAIARIHSRLSSGDVDRLDFMLRKSKEILAESGASKPFEQFTTYDFFSSTHVFGTCRMGDDPNHAVVDGGMRSHDHQNLFITDASVFPSSGGGESPSLTISALALRLSDTLAP
ncbi:GMC family oxidoreductase [Guyparkeria sp. 1SP6A2]|nr:GMC family oxidoreductase [Guyparkeria sp. 1SP6A2]